MRYASFEDPLLQYAFDYVASLHPNIVNYDIKDAFYQIVAGINIKINYKGLDKCTSIEAVVQFDLSSKPSLNSFQVFCVEGSLECSDNSAAVIYNTVEGVILIHPQLISFRIVNFLTETTNGVLRMLVTFANGELGLRTLTEIEVINNKSTILSFFTYRYEQE